MLLEGCGLKIHAQLNIGFNLKLPLLHICIKEATRGLRLTRSFTFQTLIYLFYCHPYVQIQIEYQTLWLKHIYCKNIYEERWFSYILLPIIIYEVIFWSLWNMILSLRITRYDLILFSYNKNHILFFKNHGYMI